MKFKFTSEKQKNDVLKAIEACLSSGYEAVCKIEQQNVVVVKQRRSVVYKDQDTTGENV